MKTNEIITEGPLDAVKGAWQGAQAGWTAGRAASKFQKDVNAVAKDAYSDWAGVLSTINPNATPDQVEQQLVSWSNTKFKDKVPGVSGVPPPQLQNSKDTSSMYKYVRARSEEYWRARAGQGPETIDSTGIRGPVRGEPTIPQDDTTPPAAPAQATAPSSSAQVSSRLRRQVQTDLRQLASQQQIQGIGQYLAPAVTATANTVRSTGVPLVDAFLNSFGIKTR